MKQIKAISESALNLLRALDWRKMTWRKRILLVAVMFAILMFLMMEVTGQPGFCKSCHIMEPYYATWKASVHNEVNCMDCHSEPGFAGYVKGKSVAPAHLVNYVLGRAPTKPNATVQDISCLRAECHNSEELVSKDVDYNGVKFTHKGHIENMVDGITISCRTCHSRVKDGEHFNVNNQVCFTCHFLENKQTGTTIVQTDCRSCHNVPDKVIKRGLVTIDHAEFVSYESNCDESCHSRYTENENNVSGGVCFNCHGYGMEECDDPVQLHATHTNCEKVECFACHGEVLHSPTRQVPVTVMMDCNKCHSETHNIQRRIYTAEDHLQNKPAEHILDPMFISHVECAACHIEKTGSDSQLPDSMGSVAKAVPRACDACHEKGTGEIYIPFWQGKIRELFEQVNSRLERLRGRRQMESDEKTIHELEEGIAQAGELLDAVRLDGSWGVHNPKYTEAMLLEANRIIAGAE